MCVRLGLLAAVIHAATALSIGVRVAPARARASTCQMANKQPNDFLTLYTTFTVVDWEAARPITEEYMARVKKESGLVFCGFDTTRSERSRTTVGGFATVPGDKLFCRQAYASADALLAHVENVRPCVDSLLDGPMTLDDMAVHGPASALEVCRSRLEESTSFFEIDSGHSSLKKVCDGVQLPLTLTCVHSSFLVTDWEAARPLMDAFLAQAAEESGCVYCGWARDGDRLFCREAFENVVAIARHVEGAAASIDTMLEGAATLESTAVHSTLANIKLFQEFLGDTGRAGMYGGAAAELFYKESGIQKFERQQSIFGFLV